MLKSRNFAFLASAVMIAFTVIILGGNAMNKLRAEADTIFQNGGKDELTSIQKELDKLVAYGNNLIVVSGRAMPSESQKAKALENAVKELQTANTVSEKHQAAEKLISGAAEIYKFSEGVSMDEKDRGYFNSINADIETSRYKISKSSYNEEARRINKELSGFPQLVIRLARNIRPVQIYE